MGKRVSAFAGVLILTCVFFAGCFNPLNPSNDPDPGARGGLVRIVICDTGSGNARTVQPLPSALAGYRLTFSSGHEPVDITEGTSTEVYLADGTYTITATAYKAGGEIGKAEDAAASGSISVTLLNGMVAEDMPPIILGPAGTGDGTLEYTITSADAVRGTMKLWEINGTTPVSVFGISGVLTIDDFPASGEIDLPTSSYIAEIRRENGSGGIAFRREVVEIWAGTTTAFVFEPASYLTTGRHEGHRS
jgi:hypothetical protein